MFEVRNQGKKQILYYAVETNLYTGYFVYLHDINIVMGHIFTSDFRKV